ncbi:hypothetical protein QJS10_CPA02g00587 [Acorus calamus]|uniref:Uncharacterized protein n=1 Tax=Acorus calamus TaxID=4465 RepID=A0AAV9FBJ3_ACOCL|nr:hypothetical protein QJS10_CPA02g00587 [Acorus calamus]
MEDFRGTSLDDLLVDTLACAVPDYLYYLEIFPKSLTGPVRQPPMLQLLWKSHLFHSEVSRDKPYNECVGRKATQIWTSEDDGEDVLFGEGFSESGETWKWFLEGLHEAIGMVEGDNWVVLFNLLWEEIDYKPCK